MGGIVAPFVVGAEVGDRGFDLDDQQRAVAVAARRRRRAGRQSAAVPSLSKSPARAASRRTPRAIGQRGFRLPAVAERMSAMHALAPSRRRGSFGRLFGDHQRRRIGVARGDARHHGRVGDAQPARPRTRSRASTTARDRRRAPSSRCRPDGRSSCRYRRPRAPVRPRLRSSAPGRYSCGEKRRSAGAAAMLARQADRVGGDAAVLVRRSDSSAGCAARARGSRLAACTSRGSRAADCRRSA